MNKRKGKSLYWMRKPFLSLTLLAVLSSLTACQSVSRSLVAAESFQMGNNDLSIDRTSAYIRQFQCRRVDEVELKLLRIESGKIQKAWDGKHKRAEGTSSSSCLMALFYGAGDEYPPYIDFSFSGQLTSASGRSEKIVQNAQTESLDPFSFKEINPSLAGQTEVSEAPLFQSWEMPSNTSIRTGSAQLLYWKSAIPASAFPEVADATSRGDVVSLNLTDFSSVQKIEDFTRSNAGSIFWVITIEPVG